MKNIYEKPHLILELINSQDTMTASETTLDAPSDTDENKIQSVFGLAD